MKHTDNSLLDILQAAEPLLCAYVEQATDKKFPRKVLARLRAALDGGKYEASDSKVTKKVQRSR